MEQEIKQEVVTRDPVCGMTVDPGKAKYSAEHGGKKYLFCCAGCQQKFVFSPEQYLNAKPGSGLVTLGGPAKAAPEKQMALPLVALGSSSEAKSPIAQKSSSAKVKDTICGMDVDPATAKFRSERDGATHYF